MGGGDVDDKSWSIQKRTRECALTFQLALNACLGTQFYSEKAGVVTMEPDFGADLRLPSVCKIYHDRRSLERFRDKLGTSMSSRK